MIRKKIIEKVIPPAEVAKVLNYIINATKKFTKDKFGGTGESEVRADIIAEKLRKVVPDEVLENVETALKGREGKNILNMFKQKADESYPPPLSVIKEARRRTFYDTEKMTAAEIKKIGMYPYNKGGVKRKSKSSSSKKLEMLHGGAYKGKKHSYAAGGKVNKLKF
tara:strand:- start:6 stop:503 length:498 start_codon:yes stop_codon:yes gene_type:complete